MLRILPALRVVIFLRFAILKPGTYGSPVAPPF